MSRAAAFLCLAVLTAPAGAGDKTAAPKQDTKKDDEGGPKLTARERQVVELTNAERKKAELPPLKANARLMAAARAHAANMAQQDKLDHVLDDKAPADRARAAGYPPMFVGENIAWNQQTPQKVVAGWMNSESHRKNILHAAYTEIGVAVAENARGEPYWVQVFGKPKP